MRVPVIPASSTSSHITTFCLFLQSVAPINSLFTNSFFFLFLVQCVTGTTFSLTDNRFSFLFLLFFPDVCPCLCDFCFQMFLFSPLTSSSEDGHPLFIPFSPCFDFPFSFYLFQFQTSLSSHSHHFSLD